MNRTSCLVIAACALAPISSAAERAPDATSVEKQFRELPIEARRLTGPLFWLHGDESRERLETYLDRVAESGNGCFTAESRPHNDWLGPGWYRDLDICLKKAKKLDLKMWIFDERWWPSQGIGGKVPPRYAAKTLVASAEDVEGPRTFRAQGYGGQRYVATVAGRVTAEGKIEGASLVDLAPHIRDGKLSWQAPAGKWKIMKFTHKQAPGLGQGGTLSVDGASRDCVDWFIQTVYQPHYDRFEADFGKAIPGFFYDEPETRGDWGTELDAVLAEWKVDWKTAYVAYKFQLAGDDDTAAKFQYRDAFAETWGRTMYGGITKWCHEHNVLSIGHFMEHGYLYVHPAFCAGDMMRLQKYSDMGAIDLVCRQMYPGHRPHSIYQTPKLASSITHAYNKPDDVTMCEIFGAYGQDITYSQMKWLTDQMQVRGVNFMIPHSFNPRAPYDRDCPPYFYNGGYEPRYPLHRVYADYTSRLALMLTGGRHVCPVALLFCGNTRHVGKAVTPEDMTSALQDALYDCDWMPLEVFQRDASLDGKQIKLHREEYRVLIVPSAEVIPYATLAKVKEFFDRGGVVIGYGFLPSKSATIGKASAEIVALCDQIWGADAEPGLTARRTNAAGGRSYLLPQKPKPEEITAVLAAAAGICPMLEVVEGQTDGWLHVLHRQKSGQDIFLVCNQNHQGDARRFTFRISAQGEPECWDAMRNEITLLPVRRIDRNKVELTVTMEPLESVLIVFQPKQVIRPARIESGAAAARRPIVVVRDPNPAPAEPAVPEQPKSASAQTLRGCKWVWFPEGNPAAAAPAETRYFRHAVTLPAGRKIKQTRFVLTADNDFILFVNGQQAGKSDGSADNWRRPKVVDVTGRLRPGVNLLAIAAVNLPAIGASPAGLVGRLRIDFQEGEPIMLGIDKTWKAADKEQAGWNTLGFDDSAWVAAREVVAFGGGPWGNLEGRRRAVTVSPVKAADPFRGRCTVPADVDLAGCRVYLEMEDLPGESAAVTVNGAPAGGMIGKPFRLNVTKHVKKGVNEVQIVPLAPKTARLVFFAK